MIKALEQPAGFKCDGWQGKAPLLWWFEGPKGACDPSNRMVRRAKGCVALSSLQNQPVDLHPWLCFTAASFVTPSSCALISEGLEVCLLPQQHPDDSGCLAGASFCLTRLDMITSIRRSLPDGDMVQDVPMERNLQSGSSIWESCCTSPLNEGD